MARKITFVVFGASGDLARRKTFPSLISMFLHGSHDFATAKIVGFARSDLGKEGLANRIKKSMPEPPEDGSGLRHVYHEFLNNIEYVRAVSGYDHDESYRVLDQHLTKFEKEHDEAVHDLNTEEKHMRLFYIALPPESFEDVAAMIHKHCWKDRTINRLIIEKPYGMNVESAKDLSISLSNYYDEDDVYRIDHYLGKDILKQILAFRFSTAGTAIGSLFHQNLVSHIVVELRESIGIEGRGGYFDEAGIVRDVMANHVMNLLVITTMDQPADLTAASLHRARINLLKTISPVRPNDVLIGQYTAHPTDHTKKAYRDEENVPADSKTPTYVAARLHLTHSHWHSTPVILLAGKALSQDRVSITLHLHPHSPSLIQTTPSCLMIVDKPHPLIAITSSASVPGTLAPREVTLEYDLRAKDGDHPLEPYEFLFGEAVAGKRAWFVGREEAEEQWRIWETYLREIEGTREPIMYHWGEEPAELQEFMETKVNERDVWMKDKVGRVVEEMGKAMERGVRGMLKQVGIEE